MADTHYMLGSNEYGLLVFGPAKGVVNIVSTISRTAIFDGWYKHLYIYFLNDLIKIPIKTIIGIKDTLSTTCANNPFSIIWTCRKK